MTSENSAGAGGGGEPVGGGGGGDAAGASQHPRNIPDAVGQQLPASIEQRGWEEHLSEPNGGGGDGGGGEMAAGG